MPISTMLKVLSARFTACASTRTWPTISPADRFRTRPILPVRQNAHAIAHPTCVDMQKVMAGVSGMNTDSIWRPSASRSRNFSVPSLDCSCATIDGLVMSKDFASADRKSRRQVGHRRRDRRRHADGASDRLAPRGSEAARVRRARFELGTLEFGEVPPLIGRRGLFRYVSRAQPLASCSCYAAIFAASRRRRRLARAGRACYSVNGLVIPFLSTLCGM